MRIDPRSTRAVEGALVPIAFPTTGLAGNIACRYLIQTLGARPFGFWDDAEAAPVVCAEGGRGWPCLRLFAVPTPCGLGGRCDRLVIACSDLSPPATRLRALARAFLEWSVASRAEALIVLEGYASSREGAVPDDAPSPSRVAGLANRDGEAMLAGLRLDRMEGLATGFMAAMMLESFSTGLPLAGPVVESHREFPDARAAALIVERLGPVLPGLRLDPEPLRAEAARWEEEVRRSRASALHRLHPPAAAGPGAGMYQ